MQTFALAASANYRLEFKWPFHFSLRSFARNLLQPAFLTVPWLYKNRVKKFAVFLSQVIATTMSCLNGRFPVTLKLFPLDGGQFADRIA
jgi:hypothetical protein